MLKTAFFFAFALLTTACSSTGGATDEEIHAADYDQRCTTNDDCVVIAEGNQCGPCAPCPGGAIAKSAARQEAADQSARKHMCAPAPEAECGVCLPASPVCVAGLCQAKIAKCFECDAGTD